MSSADSKAGKDSNGKLLKCAEIQAVLFDYMARELGEGRSDLVREHLRRCADCQKEAAEISAMLEALHEGSPEGTLEERLSDDRRKRLVRAYMHPVLDWIHSHHVMISILIALAVLVAVLGILLKTRVWNIGPPDMGPTVTIGKGEPPASVTNAESRNSSIHGEQTNPGP